MARLVDWPVAILALLLLIVGFVLAISPPSVDSARIISSTCCPPCPFDCQRAPTRRVSDEHFEKLLELVSRLPTFSLWAYADLIRHWESMRQLFWEPELARADASSIKIPESLSRTRDAAILVRALYLRSLPPPAYQRAWQSNMIEHRVVQSRVAAVLHTLLASESIQISLGQVLSRSPSFSGVAIPFQEHLKIAKGLDSENFYATSLLTIARMRQESTGDACSECKKDKCKEKPTKEAQAELTSAIKETIDVTGKTRDTPQADFFSLTHEELKELSAGEVVVYAIYLNNWIEAECTRLGPDRCQPDASLTHELVHSACDELHAYFVEERGTPKANQQGLEVPLVLQAHFQITRFEFAVVTNKDADDLDVQFNEILTLLFSEHKEWFNWYDVLKLLEYLRSGSPHLAPIWSQASFDEKLRLRGYP